MQEKIIKTTSTYECLSCGTKKEISHSESLSLIESYGELRYPKIITKKKCECGNLSLENIRLIDLKVEEQTI